MMKKNIKFEINLNLYVKVIANLMIYKHSVKTRTPSHLNNTFSTSINLHGKVMWLLFYNLTCVVVDDNYYYLLLNFCGDRLMVM